MKVGKKKTVEPLVSEEALMLAKSLRGEVKAWNAFCHLIIWVPV